MLKFLHNMASWITYPLDLHHHRDRLFGTRLVWGGVVSHGRAQYGVSLWTRGSSVVGSGRSNHVLRAREISLRRED